MASPLFDSTLKVISAISSLVVPTLVALVALLTYRRRGKLKLGAFSMDFENSLKADVALARHRLELEAERMDRSKPGLDASEKQYILLSSYHAQSLAQSKQSFWFSLVFASLGFGVIVMAILGNSPNNIDKTIKLISGTIIDAVAGLFFVQSNKARELMSEFFDKLRTDRKLDESLRLVAEVPDETLKSRLQVVLSLNFADVKLNDEALRNLLDTTGRESPQPSVTRTPIAEVTSIVKTPAADLVASGITPGR